MEIFSGEYSRKMWDEINNAETTEDLKDALYTVCCRLQELETALTPKPLNKKVEHEQAKCKFDKKCWFQREYIACDGNCTHYTPVG